MLPDHWFTVMVAYVTTYIVYIITVYNAIILMMSAGIHGDSAPTHYKIKWFVLTHLGYLNFILFHITFH